MKRIFDFLGILAIVAGFIFGAVFGIGAIVYIAILLFKASLWVGLIFVLACISIGIVIAVSIYYEEYI